MNKIKNVAIFSSVLCVSLSISLVSVVLYYQALLQQKDEQYRELYFQLIDEFSIAYEYYENWTRWKKAEVSQTDIFPADQSDFIKQHSEFIAIGSIPNGYDPRTLKTIIMHGCIKTDSNISLPDVGDFYRKNRDGFAPYEVLILPEYNGNLNWTETLQWISTNYTGVPICLSVFEGGNDKLPDPNLKLTIEDIEEAMAVSEVRMVRFAETISWHMEVNSTGLNVTYPIDEFKDILEFCRSKNLQVLWSEWKKSYDVFQLLNSTIYGYEDVVTVMYQTNNKFDELFVGYLYATQFEHWGVSVQSWFYEEREFGFEGEMPLDWMVEHAVLARNIGAEIVQFEPYWYFFVDGEPLEAMRKIWSII